MADITLTFHGGEELIQHFLSHMEGHRLRAEAMLKQDALSVLALSRRQVPYDTGSLSRSTFVDTEVTGDSVSVRLGYCSPDSTQINPKSGEPTSAYAVKVHEDMARQFHKAQGFERKSKYLEDPVNFWSHGLQTRLSKMLYMGGTIKQAQSW